MENLKGREKKEGGKQSSGTGYSVGPHVTHVYRKNVQFQLTSFYHIKVEIIWKFGYIKKNQVGKKYKHS